MEGVKSIVPFPKGISGNPAGRPKKHHSLTDHIDRRLDKPAFAQRLVDIAMGRVPDIPALVQASCMRMILDRVDGLAVRREELERKVTVVVEYVEESRCSDVIDVHPLAQLESREPDLPEEE